MGAQEPQKASESGGLYAASRGAHRRKLGARPVDLQPAGGRGGPDPSLEKTGAEARHGPFTGQGGLSPITARMGGETRPGSAGRRPELQAPGGRLAGARARARRDR